MNSLVIGKRSAISNWLRQFSTIIDLENKLYKVQESMLGIFKWGTFKPLPKIDYVLVFRSFFAKCESCSLEEYEANSYFQVSLVYKNKHRIIVHETRKKEEAFSMAKNIATGLNTHLKDSATDKRQSVWLQ